MLKVKTYIRESIQLGCGMGCFADEFIPANTLIWEYNPLIDRRFTDIDLEKFTDLELQFIDTYSYKFDGYYYLCVDNARFMNHNNNPNTYECSYEQKTYSAVDIKRGTELLSNYEVFGKTNDDKNFNFLKRDFK